MGNLKVCTCMNTVSSLQKRFPVMPTIYMMTTSLVYGWIIREQGWNWWRIAAVTITMLGYTFWLMARFQLGGAFSLRPEASFLVTTGLYGRLRHPVYVFSIVTLIGIALFFNHWALYAGVVALVGLETVRKRKEEKLLVRKFGDKYRIYCQKTWF